MFSCPEEHVNIYVTASSQHEIIKTFINSLTKYESTHLLKYIHCDRSLIRLPLAVIIVNMVRIYRM